MSEALNAHLLILGLVDHILERLGSKQDRYETRNYLLSAITANFTSSLLDDPQIAEQVKAVAPQLQQAKDVSDSVSILTQQFTDTNMPQDNYVPFLKAAAKSTLSEFVNTTAMAAPLDEMINTALS